MNISEEPPTFEVIGRTADLLHSAFWWHEEYRSFFDSAGVPYDLVERAYAECSKNKACICRSILNELRGKGLGGIAVAWKVIDGARALTGPVHPDNCDMASFEKRRLRFEQALEGRSNRIGPSEAEKERQATDRKLQQLRNEELRAIRERFGELMIDRSIEPTKRGYELENLIGRLCKVHRIEYEPPLRLPGQQTDGAIKFEGQWLIVEARWRNEQADFGDIEKLSGKARARIVGTLGLFLSMEGFSTEGVNLWLSSGHQRDCILLRGTEFVKVVNDYIAWPEALRAMIDQAAVRGQVLVDLSI